MYTLEKKVGSGTWGEVFIASNAFGQRLAVKKIPKEKVSLRKIQKEVRAAKRCRVCPGVVYYHETYEDDLAYYLVFDFCEGKDLLKIITESNFEPFKEEVAKKIIESLVRTLIKVHKARVVHHDLKLENILVNPKTNEPTLIDFGLADIVGPDNDNCSGDAGSYEYLPPEKIFPDKRKSFGGFKSDIWSLGTILFALLFAQFPWSKRERKESIDIKNIHPKLNFPSERAGVSQEGRDLIKAMLEQDPEKRIGLEDILLHPWMKESPIALAKATGNLKRSSSAGE
jgi:5'-AMP-activated protein kinase catalytic alpha subunit